MGEFIKFVLLALFLVRCDLFYTTVFDADCASLSGPLVCVGLFSAHCMFSGVVDIRAVTDTVCGVSVFATVFDAGCLEAPRADSAAWLVPAVSFFTGRLPFTV